MTQEEDWSVWRFSLGELRSNKSYFGERMLVHATKREAAEFVKLSLIGADILGQLFAWRIQLTDTGARPWHPQPQ